CCVFSSRRRHTRCYRDWSSDVCSSDLYHTIGRQGGVMDVILVAVKKSKVLEYVSVVSEAGFEPSIVDVDGFALANQFELNFPEERGEAVALIDIGASTMKTNVVRGGATIFARDIPFGGNNYTQA